MQVSIIQLSDPCRADLYTMFETRDTYERWDR
jgi:hypothetical protein